MVAHRHTGRPEIRYRYDSDGRVTEQLNPAGLSYTYQYEKDRITITDSLDRREVLHTQGEAGLKRVVKKEHADGSVTQSQFDAVGRLRTQTDAAGRTTEYSPDVVTGLITRITTPDGRASAFYYNHHSQLTSATGPDGAGGPSDAAPPRYLSNRRANAAAIASGEMETDVSSGAFLRLLLAIAHGLQTHANRQRRIGLRHLLGHPVRDVPLMLRDGTQIMPDQHLLGLIADSVHRLPPACRRPA